MNKYTDETNIRILISLLKKHNIKDIIVNPGTTNISFVASIQNDNFFTLHSCVDERSSAYMACGIAAETNRPVVLTCTGATASRNYMPGLTEAFYSKLPVIAITATQHQGRIGQNVAQVIDRSMPLKDIVKTSVTIPSVYTEEDHWACNLAINNALLECTHNGCGPVHINMVTTYSNNFTKDPLPDERLIQRVSYFDEVPKIETDNVAIFIGAHSVIGTDLQNQIEKFCEKYNGVVLCDHTSNYYGKYKVLANLTMSQPTKTSTDLRNIKLLLDIGNISGAYAGLSPQTVWRINPDGIIRDTYKKLTTIFEMREIDFFDKYNSLPEDTNKNSTYFKKWNEYDNIVRKKFDNTELPFSNIWVAKNLAQKITEQDIIHFGILNTLRSWNFIQQNTIKKCHCNTGGFGIDGIMSTAIGNSLYTTNKIYCLIGDLAFFYDINSLGNNEIKNNLRILLINNGCGTEFHNFNHRASKISSEQKMDIKFFAADGHFGNKSKTLVKHFAIDLGFDYLSASNKEEFMQNINTFTKEYSEKPIIFEIFTNERDESDALKAVCNLDKDITSMTKKILNEKSKKILKNIIYR